MLWRKYRDALPRAKMVLLPAALIYTFGSFGAECLNSTDVYLIEQAVCREYHSMYGALGSPIQVMMDENLCKAPEIQAQVARIHGVFSFLIFLPPLFFTGPYSFVTSLLGKKTIIFLNTINFACAGLYFTSVCYFHDVFDIRWIYLKPLFGALGGGSIIMFSLLYSYIAENVPPDELSGVLNKFNALQWLMSFLAMSLSSYLLRTQVWLLCMIGVFSLVLAIPAALLLPESGEPKSRPDESFPTPSSASSDYSTATLTDVTECTSLLKPKSTSLLQSPKTLEIRPYLEIYFTRILESLRWMCSFSCSASLISAIIFSVLLLNFSAGIRVLFSQWAAYTFRYTFANVNSLAALETVLSGTVLLSLPMLRSRFLKPYFSSNVDLIVTKLSLVARSLGILCMGFAPNIPCFIIALMIFTLGAGMFDSLRVFLTGQMGSKEEVERLYMGIGIVESIGYMLGNAIWSTAFAGAVESERYWRLRIPFLGSVASLALGFGGLWMLGRLQKQPVEEAGADEPGSLTS